jgi:protein gp37
VDAPIRFLSCEPLKEDVAKDLPDLTMFDWVIIGGQSRTTGEPAAQPEWAWVENLVLAARKSGLKIYFKPNLTVPTNFLTAPKEYPKACAASLFDHEAGLA